jgi:eukaryotic-like serine/threonine-protein kinase
MIATWKQWEGVCLAGEFGLDEWLGESDRAAFYRTSYGPDHRPAVLKLIPADAIDSELQLELWRDLRELSHPALLQLLDFGCCQPDGGDGDSCLYAVYEFPEDTLEAALGRVPLTEMEKRDIREAAANALLYLHGHGFVHGAIDAGHVVAVGNQIKLSSDTVRRASREDTLAEDWRRLELLVPGTTAQSAPAIATAAQAPAPFAPIHELPPPPRFTLPAWAIGAIAGAVVAGGFWFLPKGAPLAPKSYPQSVPRPVAAVKPLPPAPQPQTQTVTLPEWRVIAYTYSSYQAAARRAAAIAEKWPDAAAEVFRPKSHSPYLVALGGWMTRDDAVRLLKIAHGKGLPRDTYIQNYSR